MTYLGALCNYTDEKKELGLQTPYLYVYQAEHLPTY